MEHILRIDLSKGMHSFSLLPEAYRFLGGRALTSRIVGDEVDPTCDPLGPSNKLVLAPGLLSGTALSSSNRISAGAKSPLTGGIKEANAGGQTGLRLGQLGLRAVIIEGQAQAGQWQIAIISKDDCRLEPAADLVGLGTYDAARRLHNRFGPKAALALIGPAGEQRMNVAGICNTDPEGRPSRICARGGLGAVMGAKGLKAVVVLDCGTGTEIADLPHWRDGAKVYHLGLRENAQVARFKEIGTAMMMEFVNKLGGLPIRNFSRGQEAKAEAITGIRMAEVIKERKGDTSHSCMTGCVIQCSNVWNDAAGKETVSSMEFETNCLFGSNLEIYDFDAIARFAHTCNDLGIDTIETGAAIGVAMQAGLLPWGDVEAVADLVRQIGTGSPMGRLIGAGAAITGRALGVVEVPVVKGQAMSAYDPRVIKGNGVTYATSAMGADHTAGNTVGAPVDHLDPRGKVALSRDFQIMVATLDMLGLCNFVRSIYSTHKDQIRQLFVARFGQEISHEEIRRLAVESLRGEVAFNRAAGLGPATDRLPEWMRTQGLPPHQSTFDVPDEELDAIWADA